MSPIDLIDRNVFGAPIAKRPRIRHTDEVDSRQCVLSDTDFHARSAAASTGRWPQAASHRWPQEVDDRGVGQVVMQKSTPDNSGVHADIRSLFARPVVDDPMGMSAVDPEGSDAVCEVVVAGDVSATPAVLAEQANALRNPIEEIVALVDQLATHDPLAPVASIVAALGNEADRLSDQLGALISTIDGSTPSSRDEPPSRRRVLIVDDSPVNRLLTTSQLRKLNYEVAEASSGAEALAFLEHEPCDLVLLDWHMPGMNGLETAGHIRRAEETGEGQRRPVLALTARAMPGDRSRCMTAGMDDVLTKPVSIIDLQEMLEYWLAEPGPEHRPETPVTAESTTADLVDRETLRSLTDDLGDPAIVRSLVETFRLDLPNRIKQLRQGLTDDDRHAIQRLTHTLRSSSAIVGALELSEMAGSIELAARDTTEPLDPMVAALIVLADDTGRALGAQVCGAPDPDLDVAGTPKS